MNEVIEYILIKVLVVGVLLWLLIQYCDITDKLSSYIKKRAYIFDVIVTLIRYYFTGYKGKPCSICGLSKIEHIVFKPTYGILNNRIDVLRIPCFNYIVGKPKACTKLYYLYKGVFIEGDEYANGEVVVEYKDKVNGANNFKIETDKNNVKLDIAHFFIDSETRN